MAKEGYVPTSGMRSAAKRAIKLKEQGKAKGAGTAAAADGAGITVDGAKSGISVIQIA